MLSAYEFVIKKKCNSANDIKNKQKLALIYLLKD
jgi:hypothetical protein